MPQPIPRKPGPHADRALQALNRKLERLELAHLREFIEEQRATIEALQAELTAAQWNLRMAEDNAERWRDDFLGAIQQAGAVPGLTVDGHVLALQPAAVH